MSYHSLSPSETVVKNGLFKDSAPKYYDIAKFITADKSAHAILMLTALSTYSCLVFIVATYYIAFFPVTLTSQT